MSEKNYQLAVELRHELHQHPEPSMEEVWTKQRLLDFMKENTTQWEIHDRGRWLYAKYSGTNPTKKIAFRGDFDAVPVPDEIDKPYKSLNPGWGHKCGHDGHVANLCYMAMEVEEQGMENDIYLIFQHGEEIGGGGEECSQLIDEEGIDEIYAFHCYTGFPKNHAVFKNGTMCCASKGMEIKFTGAPAHASTPEHGRNPALAIAHIINGIPALIDPTTHKGLVLATVIQVDVGERAFGVSAHQGVLLLTIRGEYEDEMDQLQASLEAMVQEQATQYGLEWEIAYYDEFPLTANHDECADKVRAACAKLGIPIVTQTEPNRGSEDYGYYMKKTKGAFFWISGGEDLSPCHCDGFDFDDEQMKIATSIFLELAK